VEQHGGAAVRLTGRRHVHVRHPHVLSVHRQRHEPDRMRVRNVFERRAHRLDVGGGLDLCARRAAFLRGDGRHDAEDDAHDENG
jgi:hypothetical protein